MKPSFMGVYKHDYFFFTSRAAGQAELYRKLKKTPCALNVEVGPSGDAISKLLLEKFKVGLVKLEA